MQGSLHEGHLSLIDGARYDPLYNSDAFLKDWSALTGIQGLWHAGSMQIASLSLSTLILPRSGAINSVRYSAPISGDFTMLLVFMSCYPSYQHSPARSLLSMKILGCIQGNG